MYLICILGAMNSIIYRQLFWWVLTHPVLQCIEHFHNVLELCHPVVVAGAHFLYLYKFVYWKHPYLTIRTAMSFIASTVYTPWPSSCDTQGRLLFIVTLLFQILLVGYLHNGSVLDGRQSPRWYRSGQYSTTTSHNILANFFACLSPDSVTTW